MSRVWQPETADAVRDAVNEALLADLPVEIVGTGSRRALGRPVAAEATLDLSGLTGVVDYQPEELVITLNPGAGLAEVEALLGARGQMLAFEPPDFGSLWGQAPGLGTIGGCIMTGRGGPRRLTAGAPRDHCLGIKGVNGFGEAFGAGGRVVKNVTGFDLPKLVAGSFGTLCAITELTLKAMPAPQASAGLVLAGLADADAVRAMSRALGSPVQVSAAAHLPQAVARDCAAVAGLGASATLLRLEGTGPSVAARLAHLKALFRDLAAPAVLDDDETRAVWKQIADAAFFAVGRETVVWKLSVAPSQGAALGQGLADELGGRRYYDWGGGGVWLELPPAPDAHAAVIRGRLSGGHATLMRGSEAQRRAAPALQPLPPGEMTLTRAVKHQFDPRGLLNPGRMYGDL